MTFSTRPLLPLCLSVLTTAVVGVPVRIPPGFSEEVGNEGPFEQRDMNKMVPVRNPQNPHWARAAGYQWDERPLTTEEQLLLKALHDRAERTQTRVAGERCRSGIWGCPAGRRSSIPHPLPWQPRQDDTFQSRDRQEFGQRFPEFEYENSDG